VSARRPALAVAALLVAAGLGLTACGSAGPGAAAAQDPVASVAAHQGKYDGVDLNPPYQRPQFTLTSDTGGTYDFTTATKGKPTLLFFGYTNCPDVCPLTMSNIAVAKKQLPKAEQDKLRVVFVTTDPQRDTPAELGKWLRGIDPQFVGLTGDFSTIQAGARTLGISIEPTHKDKKTGKTVSVHGTQVIAFSPKTDGGYVLYDEDAQVGDYTKDLPKIIKGENP